MFQLDPSGTRAEFEGLLAESDVDALAADPKLEVLQFMRPVPAQNWALLEEALFRKRHDVELRVYGHHGAECDLSFVQEVPSLRRFCANCLTDVSNIDALGALRHLRRLNLGILELKSFDILEQVSDQIEWLLLGDTRSRRPSLESLPRFANLRWLSVGGHAKGLGAIAENQRLEELTLWSLSDPELSFLEALPQLWGLELNLGGAVDLSAITGARELKRLELTWIRRLSDISFISDCVSLQDLRLDRLKQVREIPSLCKLVKLRALSIGDLNGLRSVDAIAEAPALEWFGYSGKTLAPEDFRVALGAPSLKRAGAFFGSQKKEKAFNEVAAEMGVATEWEYQPFVYD